MRKIVFILLFSIVSVFAFEELNSSNFEEKIKDKNAIVDFYAVWCPPCKILNKNLQQFNDIKPKSVTIFKLNIDNEANIAKKYGVNRLPTLLYFKNGELVKEIVGVQSTHELIESSKKYFDIK